MHGPVDPPDQKRAARRRRYARNQAAGVIVLGVKVHEHAFAGTLPSRRPSSNERPSSIDFAVGVQPMSNKRACTRVGGCA